MRIIPVIAVLLILIGVGGVAGSQVPPTNEKKQVEQKTTETPINTAKKPTQDVATGARVTETEISTLGHCCQVCAQNSEKNNSLISKLSDPTAIFTGLLVLATFALWWATRNLVRSSESTAEQQLRAYVFTKHDQPATKSEEGHFIASIMVKNFGQTPAKDLTSFLHIGLHKLPLTAKLDTPTYEPNSSKSPLAPGEQFLQEITFAETFNQSEINAITKGEGAIFVHGELRYSDVFNKQRFTRFCLYSTGEAFKEGQFAYYHEGNEAN